MPREASERASWQREEKGAPGGWENAGAASNPRSLYMHLGKAGPSELLTPGSPLDFIIPGPAQLPTPDYSARGGLTLLHAARSSHPALGGVGPRENTQAGVGRDSGWVVGTQLCSWSPRDQWGLGTGSFVVAASPGSESAHGRTPCPTVTALLKWPQRCHPRAVSGCSCGDPKCLALHRRVGSVASLCFAHCVTEAPHNLSGPLFPLSKVAWTG